MAVAGGDTYAYQRSSPEYDQERWRSGTSVGASIGLPVKD